MQKREYPNHIYEKIRSDIAISIISHELRKLLWNVPESYFEKIDKNINEWASSPEMGYPRDFWNGFHGIIMGFKLKIFLTYLITAENIEWTLEGVTVSKLHFGVEQSETRHIRPGKLSALEVKEYYSKPENHKTKEKFIKLNMKLSAETSPRDSDPIIAYQQIRGGEIINSVHDGNRRLAKAALEGKERILTYLGSYKTDEKMPLNYWIPTSILMENLYFARLAYDQGNKNLFNIYMSLLSDMIIKSKSAAYEMQNRAVTTSQPFRDEVFKALNIQ